MKIAPLALLATSLVLPLPAHAQKPNMQDGLWEITVKVDMPGMPANMGSQTVRKCYTPKDVSNAERTLHKDHNCDVSDLKTSGNTVKWTMRCKPPQEMQGTGEMTYRGASYDGRIRMAMKQNGETINMTQQLSGKRVGPCTQK